MSSSNIERACQWQGCSDAASKHVTYGNEPAGREPIGEIGSKLLFSIYHANLCAAHIAKLRQHYAGVQERDLGYCSEDCPSG